MSATSPVTIKSTEWIKLADAGSSVLFTPEIPGRSFWVYYEDTKPNNDFIGGHKYFAKDDIPNAILGGTNTEAINVKMVHGEDITAFVTVV